MRQIQGSFRSARGRFVVLIVAVALLSIPLVQVAMAAPSNFVDITNHQVRWSGTGDNDWANGAATSPAPCSHPTTVGGLQTCPGTNGLFDGGMFQGATTPPTPPAYIGPTANVPAGARDFIVDALSVDHTVCEFPPSAGGSATAITGDPTVYTGAGSETNGSRLDSDTWGDGSTPNKDDLSNIYALGHRVESGGVVTVYEIFFGGERVVNNGDSHIDFEFLQSTVTLVPGASGCAGSFAGDRSQGDMLLSVDFTAGGTLGGTVLYQWHCVAESGTQPVTGTICNPPAHGKSVPHYQQTGSPATDFGVNSGGAVDCGGWVCRNADGTLNTQIQTNELMEGGIDLLQLGFTGCLSSFLPHTRSSQSFTSVLKDFALASFDTCQPTTAMTVSPSASQLVHKGDSVAFTFNEANDGNVSLTNPSVSVSFSPAGPTGCAATTLSSGDTNNNSILDPGETFAWTCTATFPTAGIFTVTGTGHGFFQGTDITFPGDPEERTQTEVRVISPATTLTKSRSPAVIKSGDTVTYTYTETNGSTGGNPADRAISGVSISDDKCSSVTFVSGDTNSNTKLDFDETWTFTCSTTITAAQSGSTPVTVTNTATATGTDALNFTVTWCSNPGSPPANTICSQTERATASVTVIHPSTSLTKLITAVVNVTYTYKETNDGDDPLTLPSVSDNKCAPVTLVSGDANTNSKLDPGETWVFTCSKLALLTVDTDGSTTLIPLTDSAVNTATGSGTDSLGTVITYPGDPQEQDQTTVTVTVSHP